MMRKPIFFVLALLAAPVLAQQPPASIMTLEQRVEAHIGALAVQNASLGFQVDRLRAQLAAATARIKALEEKYEPNKPANQ